MEKPIWEPSPERIAKSNLTRFIRAADDQWGVRASDYRSLYEWSIERPEQFWKSVWDFAGVIAETAGDIVIANHESMFDAKWFPDARLNFAENLLRRRDNDIAVVFWCEERYRRSLSYEQLYDLVSRIVQALRSFGVSQGDRVVAVLPNMPEALACMLAVNSLGAIWSSCSPDLGAQSLLDRLGQIEPKILIGVDGYFYNGKGYDTLSRLDEVCRALPSVENVVLIPFLEQGGARTRLTKSLLFKDFIAPFTPDEIPFTRLPFDQPAFVLYSSGTTGRPKCIVHAGGRALIKLLEEHSLQFDVKRGQGFFYFTTTGWNMWYTLVTALGVGAKIFMYEGSPFYPKPDIVFDFASQERVSVLGTSPKYIGAIRQRGLSPMDTHDLAELHTVLSTGAPLSPESFDYVYTKIKRDVRLSSISGGTEIIATFVNGNPVGPVWRGELQARALGMRVEVFDERGMSIRNQKGELVCTAPFVSRPLYFWNDPENRRYYETYFSKFPDVWCHGDFAELTEHDGMIIYGRSDATLNPGGVRIGTAEIYRPVEELEEVADALVVGQEWGDDMRIVLFVKLRDGYVLNDGLIEKIRRRIREYATPRHVPAKVIRVDDIPYTINGKKVELAVTDIIHRRPVKNLGSLVNPAALELFRDRPELRT